MKKQSGKAFNPDQPLTDIELRTIKAGWDEWGNQGETGSLGGDLFENNAGTAVVGAGDAGTSPEEDTWSWATLDVPPDLNTQSADEGEDEGAAAAQAQADADAAAAAQGQADAGAAAAAQSQADADAAAAAQSQADAAAAAAQAQADADAAADDAAQAQADADAAQAQADADAAQAQADADAAAAAAAQAQADEDAAAAAQAAADDAARAAASAYDAQVAADAAAQAALLAGDDDGDDDDSDDDDGYGGSIFNDYSLLSGSTAASNQSSANGFLTGSNPNSFQVPLTASAVANLFGSGSGSLISSPVDLGSGPGGDPATSAIGPNSAGRSTTDIVLGALGTAGAAVGGALTGVAVDNAVKVLPIGQNNQQFLADWAMGRLPSQVTYGPNSPQLTDMRLSPGADVMRTEFTAAGGQNVRVNYGTGQAFIDTIANPFTANWSGTGMQVGGFGGATVRNNGDGTATFTINNVAGTNSFFYHIAPNNTSSTGPMHNVTQTFIWTEPVTPPPPTGGKGPG